MLVSQKETTHHFFSAAGLRVRFLGVAGSTVSSTALVSAASAFFFTALVLAIAFFSVSCTFSIFVRSLLSAASIFSILV